MQIKSVQTDEKNNLNSFEVDMSNEELRWFVSFAFNQLFKAGMFALKDGVYTPSLELKKALEGTDA